MKTKELFAVPKKPRKKREVLAHVYDAGDAGSGFDVVFKCRRCGYTSEWTAVKNTTEAKRGIPCPECNKST